MTDQQEAEQKPKRKYRRKIRRIVAYCVEHLCGHKVIVIRKSSFERMREMTRTVCGDCKSEGEKGIAEGMAITICES